MPDPCPHAHDHGAVMNEEHLPLPQCLLQMHELIETTAEKTANRIEQMLYPVVRRIERIEYKIMGNGTPGLAEQVHILQQQHEDMQKSHQDSIALRKQIWGIVGVHVAAIIAGLVWAIQWVYRVDLYIKTHQ